MQVDTCGLQLWEEQINVWYLGIYPYGMLIMIKILVFRIGNHLEDGPIIELGIKWCQHLDWRMQIWRGRGLLRLQHLVLRLTVHLDHLFPLLVIASRVGEGIVQELYVLSFGQGPSLHDRDPEHLGHIVLITLLNHAIADMLGIDGLLVAVAILLRNVRHLPDE